MLSCRGKIAKNELQCLSLIFSLHFLKLRNRGSVRIPMLVSVAHGNWLAQKTTTNRIISSQGLIIIRSRRNTFIIRNENKHKSSLYLVAKFRKCQCKLTSVAGRYNSCTLQVSTESFTDSPGKRVYKRIFQVSGFNRQTKKYFFLTSILLKTGLKYNNLTPLNQCI